MKCSERTFCMVTALHWLSGRLTLMNDHTKAMTSELDTTAPRGGIEGHVDYCSTISVGAEDLKSAYVQEDRDLYLTDSMEHDTSLLCTEEFEFKYNLPI